MDKLKLSVVILNYRSANLVKQCVRGVLEYVPAVDLEILVVDNDSHDQIEKVLLDFPSVRLIKAERNRGFAAGNNLGIKASRGEYILILNPDIAVLSGSVEKLISWLDTHAKCGMAVPQLLNPDRGVQESVMRFPKIWMPLFRRTFFRHFPGGQKLLDWYLLKDWDHRSSRRIEWALGACMLVRRDAVSAVGLLDERYFLYVEDTDWCRRFWENGWEIAYVADAPLVHYHMRESAERFFSKLNFIHLASWFKYFWKFRHHQRVSIDD